MSKKIVIVEDDEGILDAMKIVLELEGYKVRTIKDEKTLHDMKEELADLLLLDI